MAGDPRLVTPRVDPGVPVLSLGATPERVAAKEHGRTDLVVPLSQVLAAALRRLLDWCIVAAPLTLVPARRPRDPHRDHRSVQPAR